MKLSRPPKALPGKNPPKGGIADNGRNDLIRRLLAEGRSVRRIADAAGCSTKLVYSIKKTL